MGEQVFKFRGGQVVAFVKDQDPASKSDFKISDPPPSGIGQSNLKRVQRIDLDLGTKIRVIQWSLTI